MVSKHKQKQKQIYEICLANKSWGKPFTLKQFKQVYILLPEYPVRGYLNVLKTNLRTKKYLLNKFIW
jgi:hypothetical protein